MRKLLNIFKRWLLTLPPEPPEVTQPDPRTQPEYDWQYLVTTGHVIFARMNHLKFIGYRLLIALVASLVVLYYAINFATTLVAKLDFDAQPQTQRALIDERKIIYDSINFELNGRSKPTNADELQMFIVDNLNSLTKENKLAIPCHITSTIAAPWANKGSVEYPMCASKPARLGKPKRIYTFAIVNHRGDYKNWIGVFYYDEYWKYKNLDMQDFYKVPKYENFDASLLVNTLQSDFTDLPLVINNKKENNND